MLPEVLAAFRLDPSGTVQPVGSGLINHTWRIHAGQGDYILQRINDQVFHDPPAIARNIRAVGNYLSLHHPDYLLPLPAQTVSGNDMYHNLQHGYFRLFSFVPNSHTIDVVGNPRQAFAAAFQFGKFTSLLNDFPVRTLTATIPGFHNMTQRYATFQHAIKEGLPERIVEAAETIRQMIAHQEVVATYEMIVQNSLFKTRVTHHDTKISNVLFNDADEGLCVIDLDTLMPGYFLSDVGDMMRTYLSPVSEEETDLAKIEVRKDFYEAIISGYSECMHDKLTADEKEKFLFAGQLMIYMQAVRFLTDFLMGDVYYGSAYRGHNLNRARNQLVLFQTLTEMPLR